MAVLKPRDHRADGRHHVQNAVSSACIIPSTATNYQNYTISSRCGIMTGSNPPLYVDAVRCCCVIQPVCAGGSMWFQLRRWCLLHCLCLSHFSLCCLPLQTTCSAWGFWSSFTLSCIVMCVSQYVFSIDAHLKRVMTYSMIQTVESTCNHQEQLFVLFFHWKIT